MRTEREAIRPDWRVSRRRFSRVVRECIQRRTDAGGGHHVGAMLLSVILFFASIAERIPYAVLAGILLINGWNIID